MAPDAHFDTLRAMHRALHPNDDPLRVVVAGGGIAGMETMVALRGLVGHRVALTLVEPEDELTIRALEIFEPFGVGHPRRYPLAELAGDLDAELLRDAVARVDRDERRVRLRSGRELDYDALVLAVGAFPYPAYEHGVCFERAHDHEDFAHVLEDLRDGLANTVAIIVPPRHPWTLPAYELALMIAAYLHPEELTLVTSEDEPLGAFGPPAAQLVRSELDRAGVQLLTGVKASVLYHTTVELSPGARLHCDRVVHLPALSGPNTPGVLCDQEGFILVDEAFRARDAEGVFAVGDGTAGPYKQGGLAGQQADVVADLIAWDAGSDRAPRSYRPVLRALLRTAHGPRYLRAEPPGGASSAEVSEQCLWWPPSKVAARWLTPWLAARDLEGRPVPAPRRLPTGGISRVVSREPGP
jgi:sulfide:quinone oxidoreductase